MEHFDTAYTSGFSFSPSSDTAFVDLSHHSPSVQMSSSTDVNDSIPAYDQYRYDFSETGIGASNPIDVSDKSKKIQKKDKAKKRVQQKQEIEERLKQAPKKYVPQALEDPNLDEKTRKKLVQAVKNRISAQLTRDKKKAYVGELEEVKLRLSEANQQLTEKNWMLEEKVRMLEENERRLKVENDQLRHRNVPENSHNQHQHPQPITINQHYQDKEKKLLDDLYSLDEKIQEIDQFQFPMSPILSRQSSEKNQFFNYFFALTAIFAIYSGLHLKISQTTTTEQRKDEPEEEESQLQKRQRSGGSHEGKEEPDGAPTFDREVRIGDQTQVGGEPSDVQEREVHVHKTMHTVPKFAPYSGEPSERPKIARKQRSFEPTDEPMIMKTEMVPGEEPSEPVRIYSMTKTDTKDANPAGDDDVKFGTYSSGSTNDIDEKFASTFASPDDGAVIDITTTMAAPTGSESEITYGAPSQALPGNEYYPSGSPGLIKFGSQRDFPWYMVGVNLFLTLLIVLYLLKRRLL